MKKIFFAVLLLRSITVFSQGNLSLDISFGATMPTHQDLKQAFDMGIDFRTGLAINVWDEKLYAIPGGGVKWYFKDHSGGESVMEHLRSWKAGLELRYYVFKGNSVKIAPSIILDHNWTGNFYSSPSYDPVMKQNTTKPTADYLQGNGFSVAIGAIAQLEKVYFKVNYELYSPALALKQSIINDAVAHGYVINPAPNFNLSSLSLSIGYTFIFKK